MIAMRYTVGDDFARELAVRFYDVLFERQRPVSVAHILALARKSLLHDHGQYSSYFAVCDHATPVLYGSDDPGLIFRSGESSAPNTRRKSLKSVAGLPAVGHSTFVGRTWELADLGANFIGAMGSKEVSPVAFIVGLPGVGKTALSAEILELWGSRFEHAIYCQADSSCLDFDATMQSVHTLLYEEGGRYHRHLAVQPADAIYRPSSTHFDGGERLERLAANLLRALRDEPILLVLENLGNFVQGHSSQIHGLTSDSGPGEIWNSCLLQLARELRGSDSRILMTGDYLPKELRGIGHVVRLSPLLPSDGELLLREHPVLVRMMAGEASERRLARRMLRVSGFHPLLLNRLIRLAELQNLRPQLLDALDVLDSGMCAELPTSLIIEPVEPRDLESLHDAVVTKIELRIQNIGAGARRLLWVIATVNQPESVGLIGAVYGASDVAFVLEELLCLAMVAETQEVPGSGDLKLSCDVLVRGHIRNWMRAHPEEQGKLEEDQIRLGFAFGLVSDFESLLHSNMIAALRAGANGLIYCIQAQAWEALGGFASKLITCVGDPATLGLLISYLELAADSAPEGEVRWSCFGYLADALHQAGLGSLSLAWFEKAAVLARNVAEARVVGGERAWSDLGWIHTNWAAALKTMGNLDGARRATFRSNICSK